MQTFRKKFTFYFVIFLATMAGHTCGAIPQPPQTAAHEPQEVVENWPQRPKISTLTDVPTVAWNVDWAVTRVRPGYPMLDAVTHFSVHTASVESGAYHHHPQITFFQNRFFATWSNHLSGEDGPGQKVIGATSDDGMKWKSIGIVFDRCDEIRVSTANGRSLIASPFIEVDDRMFAVAIVNDGVGYGTFETPVTGQPLSKTKTEEFSKRIRRAHGYLLREILDGGALGPVFWMGNKKPAPIKGFPEFPLPTHLSVSVLEKLKQKQQNPMTQSPWDFDSPHSKITAKDGSLLSEPTTQLSEDGLMIRYQRDLGGSQKLYVQFSDDNGESWTRAERTEIPDAPSKSVFGRLPDGQFFLIGNQVVSKRGTRRDPLSIGLSKNGTVFDKAFAIRWRTPRFQVASQQSEPDGRGRGFQYPSYVIAKNALWVIYSVNKESIEVSRISVDELERE